MQKSTDESMERMSVTTSGQTARPSEKYFSFSSII